MSCTVRNPRKSPEMSSLTVPLNEDSEDWSYIEYFLKASTRSGRIKIRKLWGLSQGPEIAERFDERSRGRLVLPTFIHLNQLDDVNTVQSVCERGFKLDANGMVISVRFRRTQMGW